MGHWVGPSGVDDLPWSGSASWVDYTLRWVFLVVGMDCPGGEIHRASDMVADGGDRECSL